MPDKRNIAVCNKSYNDRLNIQKLKLSKFIRDTKRYINNIFAIDEIVVMSK